MEVLGLNTLDLLLLVILVIGLLLGLIRGLLLQLISAVSIWLGLVATLWLYKPLSTQVLQPETSGFGMGKTAGDTLAFIVLLIVFFNAFRLLVKYLSVPPEERKKKRKRRGAVGPVEDPTPTATQRFITGPLMAIGGMGMGFILTTLWLALILGVLQFIFQPTGTEVPYTGFMRGLYTNLLNSTLLRYYFNPVLALLVQSVDLFVPRNADILKAFLRFIV